MKEGNDYCGLDCSYLLEQLDKILELIIEHGKYDAEFAPVMVQKLIDKCNQTKTDLMSEVIRIKYKTDTGSSY